MWSTVSIAGKPADVFDPPDVARPRFGLLYLHGAGLETLTSSPTYTRLLEQGKLACVCPHGKLSWWTDKVCEDFDPVLTAEQHILKNVLPFFQERWGISPQFLGLFGVSMGGQGALRLAFKHPRTFRVVAGISSALDCYEAFDLGLGLDRLYDSREQCRQDTAILHIHPAHFPPHIYFCIDPQDVRWYRGNDRLHEKLAALGVAHTHDLQTQAGGHSWDYFDHVGPRVIQFLTAGLEEESRRLL
ncbi:MAG: esterase [Planctomycetia bacterium]|nr:esterase [Planctomycetia bacterium]